MMIKLNTNTLLIVLLGILVIMSGVQAVQLTMLSSAITSGSIVSSSTVAPKTSSNPPLQIQSQVGGCG
jgi:hypothetical protein